jgi:hypothetical protein
VNQPQQNPQFFHPSKRTAKWMQGENPACFPERMNYDFMVEEFSLQASS